MRYNITGRIMNVRSSPWRLTGVRVRLVNCTNRGNPILRDKEGVVEGLDYESGKVRVRVFKARSVDVWPCEVERTVDQNLSSSEPQETRAKSH